MGAAVESFATSAQSAMGGVGGAAVAIQALSGIVGGFKASGESSILKQNASIYESNTPFIRARAAEQARQLQVSSYLTRGAQRSGYGARGLAVGGSVFDIMSDTVANFNRDTSFVLLEGELQVRGMQRQADLARYQAKSVMRDAIVGSILNTASTGVNVAAYSGMFSGANSAPKPTTALNAGAFSMSPGASRFNLPTLSFSSPFLKPGY